MKLFLFHKPQKTRRKKEMVQAKISEKSGCCGSTIWSTTLWEAQEQDEAWGRGMETIMQRRWINQAVSSLNGKLLCLTGCILSGSVGAGRRHRELLFDYCRSERSSGAPQEPESVRLEGDLNMKWQRDHRETWISCQGAGCKTKKCFNLPLTSELIKQQRKAPHFHFYCRRPFENFARFEGRKKRSK